MRPRASFATAACRELIHGDGTADSIQRTIDLARIALGYDEPRDEQAALVRRLHLDARRRRGAAPLTREQEAAEAALRG